jgi:hypothetical protein
MNTTDYEKQRVTATLLITADGSKFTPCIVLNLKSVDKYFLCVRNKWIDES